MGHVGPCEDKEEPPAAVAVAVLQRRAGIMFSGNTGAVVSSEEGLATSAPSYGLVKDVLAVVDALPAELFDRHAEHRPCGLLDKYGAVGMLIGDVLGLPLMPWVLAEPIGKAAAKLPKEIAGEVKGRQRDKSRASDGMHTFRRIVAHHIHGQMEQQQNVLVWVVRLWLCSNPLFDILRAVNTQGVCFGSRVLARAANVCAKLVQGNS